MGILRFDMNMSLDGYVEDASGSFAWSDPDDEVHRLANERTAEASALLFGRRLYEVMEDFWSAPERADAGPVEAEFAAIYLARPRIVFSDTLATVADGCRLVRRAGAVAEVERLKAEHDGVLAVGGPGLAASLIDLVDEFNLFVVPTVVGGGKPVFPPGRRLDLTLVEHRTTASGWTMLRYRRAR